MTQETIGATCVDRDPRARFDPPVARVGEVEPARDGRWDRFVRAHPGANAYHLAAWATVLQRSYGYRPRYLQAEALDGRVLGVLPLLEGAGLLSHRFSSMPVAWSAGPLTTGSEAAGLLLARAQSMARTAGAGKLLVRSDTAGLDDIARGLRAEESAPAWVLKLPTDMDALERHWHEDKHLRRNLAKAQRMGLSVREGVSDDDLRAFYALYLRTMRRVHALPRRLAQLDLSRRALGPEWRLVLVEHEGLPVAGAVFHVFAGTTQLVYSASDERQLALRPNHALYRETIRWAVEQGHHVYDFGGAGDDTSLARFKQQWGAERSPVYVYGWASGDSAGALAPPKPGPRSGGVAAAWARAPLWSTRLAGYAAYRYL